MRQVTNKYEMKANDLLPIYEPERDMYLKLKNQETLWEKKHS